MSGYCPAGYCLVSAVPCQNLHNSLTVQTAKHQCHLMPWFCPVYYCRQKLLFLTTPIRLWSVNICSDHQKVCVSVSHFLAVKQWQDIKTLLLVILLVEVAEVCNGFKSSRYIVWTFSAWSFSTVIVLRIYKCVYIFYCRYNFNLWNTQGIKTYT